MEEKKMIPSNIWETDCKYCRFRESEQNFEYGSRGKYVLPCKLRIYAGNCKVWNTEIEKYLTEYEAYKDHCPSCRPNEGFGICATCQYFNCFHDDVENINNIYCTLTDGPVNRRNTMPHIKAGYSNELTSFDYTYFTCDKYMVEYGPYSRKNNLLRLALEGKIPKNFDPETFKPLEYTEGVPIEEWQAHQQAYEDCKPDNVKKKKLRDVIKQRMRKEEVR